MNDRSAVQKGWKHHRALVLDAIIVKANIGGTDASPVQLAATTKAGLVPDARNCPIGKTPKNVFSTSPKVAPRCSLPVGPRWPPHRLAGAKQVATELGKPDPRVSSC